MTRDDPPEAEAPKADEPQADTPAAAAAPSDPTSIWHPLRHPAFKALWVAGGVYFIGNAMQSTAAAWMMLEITGSSFLAALVQTAVFLPMFILVLPAGVLADIADRRLLILGSLIVQAVSSSILALLLLAGWAGAGSLLFFIFVSGCCTALLSPSWNSTVVDAVPREDLPQAITAVGIAYNAARAAGPALAGGVFGLIGGAWNFFFAVAGTVWHIVAIRRWPPKPHPPSRLPPERLWGGTVAGLRFAWHSHSILSQMIRTIAFSAAGSALWALLPVIGQRQLGLGAAGFGLLMACLGSGAVAAGFVVGRIRARVGLETLVGGCCVVFALVMLVSALSSQRWLVYGALVFGGAAWMSAMSTFNTATQTSVPPWVRARAAAMHTLSALGSFALGSAVWGAMSGLFGLPFTLCAATVAMAAGMVLAKPFPLRMGQAEDVTPATSWDELFVTQEPDPSAGPVAVEIGYRIDPHHAEAFLDAAALLRGPRRRDGATFWRLYRDLADPTLFVERFIVSSWADYLHQRARATLADQEQEARVRAFLLPGELVTMKHYLAER